VSKILLRVTLLVIAVVLASFALLLFMLEATSDGGAPTLDQLIGVRDARSQPSDCVAGPQAVPHVVITVSDFDPRALTVTLNAALCFPPEAFSRLRTSFIGPDGGYVEVPVVRGDPRYHIWVPRRFLGLTINVSFGPIIPGGREGQEAQDVVERHTTLDQLLGGSKRGEWHVAPVGRFVMPLESVPRRYPFDWYALRGELSVGDLASPLVMCRSDGCGGHFPFYLTVLSGPNISPFIARASARPAPRQQDEGNQIINIQLQRSSITRAYIVAVACLPLLLGLLLCVVLFGTSRPVGPDGLTGVAAVLLAILPIRLVLVPSDVSELTLVDFWFALEMALLAAVACVAVWRALGGSDQETRHRSQRP
jgi:hypothetical protein